MIKHFVCSDDWIKSKADITIKADISQEGDRQLFRYKFRDGWIHSWCVAKSTQSCLERKYQRLSTKKTAFFWGRSFHQTRGTEEQP